MSAGVQGNARSWFSLATCLCLVMAARGQSPVSTEWPRVFVRDGATNTVYQPQLESWDYCTLKAISAVAVQPAGTAQPVYGTIGFVATTRVDRAERQVVIESLQITNADFPFAGPQADVYLATLRSLLPKEVKTISLDRLEACLALQQAREKSYRQSLRNDAPAILLAHEPYIFPALPDRIALTLAGHLHGGQINLPVLGAPIQYIKRRSSRFVYGEYALRERRLIVSGGLGTSYAPVRVFRPPEVVLVKLGGEPASA